MNATHTISATTVPATIKALAVALEEAATTARKLPPVGPRGYAACWPEIVRSPSERYAAERKPRVLSPSGAAIDRMLACCDWIALLDEEQRHLVWQRAQRVPWQEICAWLGCNRTTAWRRWNAALTLIVVRLNEASAVKKPKEMRQVEQAIG